MWNFGLIQLGRPFAFIGKLVGMLRAQRLEAKFDYSEFHTKNGLGSPLLQGQAVASLAAHC